MPPLFVILARLPMSAPIHRHFSFAHGIPISRKLLDCPQTTQNYSALANGGNLASLTVPPTKAFSAPHASRRHFRHIHSCVIGSFSSTQKSFPFPARKSSELLSLWSGRCIQLVACHLFCGRSGVVNIQIPLTSHTTPRKQRNHTKGFVFRDINYILLKPSISSRLPAQY